MYLIHIPLVAATPSHTPNLPAHDQTTPKLISSPTFPTPTILNPQGENILKVSHFSPKKSDA
jgi:hypothetical protein